jgi:hypothetical protein
MDGIEYGTTLKLYATPALMIVFAILNFSF